MHNRRKERSGNEVRHDIAKKYKYKLEQFPRSSQRTRDLRNGRANADEGSRQTYRGVDPDIETSRYQSWLKAQVIDAQRMFHSARPVDV